MSRQSWVPWVEASHVRSKGLDTDGKPAGKNEMYKRPRQVPQASAGRRPMEKATYWGACPCRRQVSLPCPRTGVARANVLGSQLPLLSSESSRSLGGSFPTYQALVGLSPVWCQWVPRQPLERATSTAPTGQSRSTSHTGEWQSQDSKGRLARAVPLCPRHQGATLLATRPAPRSPS